MKKLRNLIRRLLYNDEGQGMVEYGLILALIAVAVVTVLGLLGGSISEKFQSIKDAIDPPAGG